MSYTNPYGNFYAYRTPANEDERIFPVLPFLTGLAFGPVLYGAFQGGQYPYPPPPPYHPYGYQYGYNPYYPQPYHYEEYY